MACYCVVCHDEFEVPEDYLYVHTACLDVDDAFRGAISKGVKGISKRVISGASIICEICDNPGVNASVSMCRICFVAAKRRLLNDARSKQLELERLNQEKKLERERFVRMTTRTPDIEIKVCRSCNLPIRQFDSRCGCS